MVPPNIYKRVRWKLALNWLPHKKGNDMTTIRLWSILWVAACTILLGTAVGLAVSNPNPENIGCGAVDIALCLFAIANYHAVVSKD